MPQFELNANERKHHAYHALDEFAQGYVEAMFFTNGDTGEDNEFLLNELGVKRLTHKAVASIKRDCDIFLGCIVGPPDDRRFVRQRLNELQENVDYSDAQAGRDLWFTRQGHGVGFWDRDELEGAGLDKLLSKAAKVLGEAYCEVHRGWIYHR